MPALLRAITAADWCPSWPMWAQRGPRWTHPRAIGGAQAVRTPHMSRLVTVRHAERRHRRHAEPTASERSRLVTGRHAERRHRRHAEPSARGHGHRTVASRDCQARRATASAASGPTASERSRLVTVRHAERRHRRHAEPAARGHGQRTVVSRDCQARRAPGSAAAGAARTPHTSYFVTVRHAEHRGHSTRRRPDGPAAAVGPRRPPAAGESAGQLTHDHGALRQQPPAGRPRRGRIRATVAAHGPIIAGRLAAPGGCRGAFR